MQSVQKLLFFVAVASVLIMPLPSDATPFEYDVSISPRSVVFVPSELYAGERVRIYANIANLGSKDVTGTVGFYQGPNLLAPPHPFSLRADSVTEDVWIDWTPMEGRYNIMVKADTDNPDQSPSNNVFLTPMMLIVKRPPPPPVQPTQPSSGSLAQVSSTPVQITGSETQLKNSQLEKAVAKKAAEKISETLTPKLPLNPPAERITQKAIRGTLSAATHDSQPNLQKPETSPPEPSQPNEITAQPTTAAPREVKGDRAFADRIPQTPLSDSTRRVLLAGILLAVASLAAGGYFLHKSKA